MKKLELPKFIECAVLNAIGYESIDDEKEETDVIEEENIVGVKITPKMLMDIENEWVERYIIN